MSSRADETAKLDRIRRLDLEIDVTDAAGLNKKAHTAVTAVLPGAHDISQPPIVCFAFPGGGYSRQYFTLELPGTARVGAQADWHAERGWIFIACDPLGCGQATAPDSPEGVVLTLESIARANRSTVEQVMDRLQRGTLADGFPPVAGVVPLAIGQSMGGAFTIILEGQHHIFAGVGILAFSAIHTVIPSRPGTPTPGYPWMPRSSDPLAPIILNPMALVPPVGPEGGGSPDSETAPEHPLAWAFHYDDVPADVVAADLAGYGGGPLQSWRSPSVPFVAGLLSSPGVVAAEAAAIDVPVLVAVGERDVVPDPWLESKAFKSARDITLFVCPQMAHMHNFAGTRELLWRRIHSWGQSVVRG